MTGYVALGNAPDTVDGRTASQAMMVNTGAGDDHAVGSRYADSINGGSGNDSIDAGAGKDVIRGGEGADRVKGGEGNDTFTFYKGDLVLAAEHGGLMDHIIDFHGAGGYKAYTGVEDDFISFFGFNNGYLEFNHALGDNERFQMYNIYDYDEYGNAVLQGNLLVQMTDGTARLSAGDYKFFA